MVFGFLVGFLVVFWLFLGVLGWFLLVLVGFWLVRVVFMEANEDFCGGNWGDVVGLSGTSDFVACRAQETITTEEQNQESNKGRAGARKGTLPNCHPISVPKPLARSFHKG